MRTLFLAVVLLALMLVPAQAYSQDENCGNPEENHKALYDQGLFQYAYTTTDQGYLLTIYVGSDYYVVLAETDEISCVVATGEILYINTKRAI